MSRLFSNRDRHFDLGLLPAERLQRDELAQPVEAHAPADAHQAGAFHRTLQLADCQRHALRQFLKVSVASGFERNGRQLKTVERGQQLFE